MTTIYVDGQLADPVPTFELYAWATLDRLHETEDGSPPQIVPRDSAGAYDVAFPHSISRLALASGLSEDEYSIVRAALASVPGLWLMLPVAKGATALMGASFFETHRFPTKPKGRGPALYTDPYVQTYQWIRKHFGDLYPAIVMEDDKWLASDEPGLSPPLD